MYPLSGCLRLDSLGMSQPPHSRRELQHVLEIEMLHIRTRSSNCTNTTPHTRAWRRRIGSKRKDDSFTPNSHYDHIRPRFSENWGSARLEEVGDLPTPLLPSSIPGHVLMKKIR